MNYLYANAGERKCLHLQSVCNDTTHNFWGNRLCNYGNKLYITVWTIKYSLNYKL